MKVIEVMERVGSGETNTIIAYIKDALSEIGSIMPERVEYSPVSIEANVRDYDFPTNCKGLLGVYAKVNTDKSGRTVYKRIFPLVHNDIYDVTEAETGGSGGESPMIIDEIIVV